VRWARRHSVCLVWEFGVGVHALDLFLAVEKLTCSKFLPLPTLPSLIPLILF